MHLVRNWRDVIGKSAHSMCRCGDSNDIITMGKNRQKWHALTKTILHRCFLVLKQKRRRSTALSVACERAWKAMRSSTPSWDCSRGFINRDLPPRAIGGQNYSSYSGSMWERPTRRTLFLVIYFTLFILDMFRTSNCSSSGGVLYKHFTVFHRAPKEESGRCTIHFKCS
jgi:hypothetical protein